MRYDFKCKECNEVFEVIKGMFDPAPTECPKCSGSNIVRVYYITDVIYNAGGFSKGLSDGVVRGNEHIAKLRAEHGY